MLDIDAIENALRVWAAGITGLETIFANPNAPRPTSPYVLIHVFQNAPIGTREAGATLKIDESADVDYSNVELLSVSINVYYSNAYKLATKLKDSLGRVTVTDQLFAAGLGYSRAGNVQDIPEIINKQWEERGQFDCFFFTRSLDEENIETIQSTEITNEIDETTVII